MNLAKAARDGWVWGQVALLLVVGITAPLMPRYLSLGDADPTFNRVDPDWIRWLSVPLILAGIHAAAWGIRSLGRNLTPETEPLAGASLVTGGPYAHVRHPIYTGMVLLLAGYTLAWSNWTLALIVGLAARAFFTGKAKAEERWLLQRHPLYAAYMRQVPRRVL